MKVLLPNVPLYASLIVGEIIILFTCAIPQSAHCLSALRSVCLCAPCALGISSHCLTPLLFVTPLCAHWALPTPRGDIASEQVKASIKMDETRWQSNGMRGLGHWRLCDVFRHQQVRKGRTQSLQADTSGGCQRLKRHGEMTRGESSERCFNKFIFRRQSRSNAGLYCSWQVASTTV